MLDEGERRKLKLRNYIDSNNLTRYQDDLIKLSEFEIVVVCDDSGSMGMIQNNPLESNGQRISRWDELKKIVNKILDISSALDHDGIDLYFLNREGHTHVVTTQQVQEAFEIEPHGATPLTSTLKRVFTEKDEVLQMKNLLVVLITDGEPTDAQGRPELQAFIDCVKALPARAYLSIVACTDDLSSVMYLDRMMEFKFPRLEVSDDFQEESTQFLSRTKNKMTYGDYICKILLGSIDIKYSESRRADKTKSSGDKCCIVM